MLWYKAWLETRWRFLLCLGGLVFFCGFFVLDRGTGDGFSRLPAFAFGLREERRLLFFAQQWQVGLTTIAAILLGMAGLLRERAIGVTLFTLALPVSRTQLVLSRVAVGFAEVLALTLSPWVAMLALLSIYMRQPIPLVHVCLLVLPVLSGGLLLFGMSILVSSLIEGEYTAPVVAFGILILNLYGTIVDRLRALSLVRFMRLQEYVDRQTWVVSNFPWASVAICLIGTVVLIAISTSTIQKRDF
ncbi:MAG TPA: hypothetical protein VNX88_23955 [Terriglobales bacterium]|jgi:ABC-type transport system involved in multi-copper enzyme maturation permease subunit|nr:hypothetical protein [Terriglobales bacterium]